ncbi:MAG TPA: hypothetical protein VF253_04220 [Candidatus Limnocylindrales bacterium]
MSPSSDLTVEAVLARASDAYASLAEVGEDIDDEWSFIQDLTEAWRARLDAVSATRGAETLDEDVAAAIDAAIDEVARIDDPHRAIDWLSTFPQVALLALGEHP